MAAMLLSFIFKSRAIFPVIAISVFSCSYIGIPYKKTPLEDFFHKFGSTYSRAWNGFERRIVYNNNWPGSGFDPAIRLIKESANFPVLQGTTDIYSYNQSLLIASGNSWNPRPVLQSQLVFTPELAELNRRHLLGARAPDNIIFRVEPIDGRIPSIEDGASWPVLLESYQPTRKVNDYLFLKKKNVSAEIHKLSMIGSGAHSFGEKVDIPDTGKPVFAEIDIRPNILGRLAKVFFKPSQLQITLTFKNGLQKNYRLIAGMAKSGLLISPLIENTSEFGLLYGSGSYLLEKTVQSFLITQSGKKISLWQNTYVVTFKQVDLPAPIDILKLYSFNVEINAEN